MATPVAATTRMSLRKREAPALVVQRDALISRFSKRPRSERDDETETDDMDDDDDDSADTESDYDDCSARPAAGARGASAAPPDPAEAASATDRNLTFLQSAQMRNNPVRSGKWNEDEEAYLRKLVQLFNAGLLDDVGAKMSMRMWLAKMLHCCPMRISKKQTHGEKFKGKAKYTRNESRIERMNQKDFNKTWFELRRLRANFLKLWAKEEFGRWGSVDRSRDFGQWYDTVVRNVPKPRLAMSPGLTVPDDSKMMEPWAAVRQDIEAVALKNREILRERETKRRHAHRTPTKKQTKPLKSAPPLKMLAPSPTHDASSVVLELPSAPQDEIFQPLEFEVDVDLAALVGQWDNPVSIVPPVSKSVDVPLDEDPSDPQASPSLVLDFGPPSLWDVDPITKDSTSPSHCEWVEDLLSDVSPSELPSEPWFQQLSTNFHL